MRFSKIGRTLITGNRQDVDHWKIGRTLITGSFHIDLKTHKRVKS